MTRRDGSISQSQWVLGYANGPNFDDLPTVDTDPYRGQLADLLNPPTPNEADTPVDAGAEPTSEAEKTFMVWAEAALHYQGPIGAEIRQILVLDPLTIHTRSRALLPTRERCLIRTLRLLGVDVAPISDYEDLVIRGCYTKPNAPFEELERRGALNIVILSQQSMLPGAMRFTLSEGVHNLLTYSILRELGYTWLPRHMNSSGQVISSGWHLGLNDEIHLESIDAEAYRDQTVSADMLGRAANDEPGGDAEASNNT